MTLSRGVFFALALTCALAACSSGSSTLTPQPHGTGSSPGMSPTPRPTATATSQPTQAGATPNIAAINTTLQSTQTAYAALPHHDLQSDLQALATQMVASRQYATAVVSYGGITATLPDGTTTLIFADHAEELGYGATPVPAMTSRQPRPSARLRVNSLSAATSHEVAFLVNQLDTSGAFEPGNQQAFATAVQRSGMPNPSYSADDLDASLENIVALGSSHPLDFFALSTHGMVAGPASAPFNANLSTTPTLLDTYTTYAADFAAHRIYASLLLQYPTRTTTETEFAFTPAFLAQHLQFNPGAIVDNTSCYSASPATIAATKATLSAVGVGTYIGWTKPVQGRDADQTDAYLIDRLLGEQKPSATDLDLYAQQQSTPQRPFPLTDIEAQIPIENRSGPMGTGVGQPDTYGQSYLTDPSDLAAPPTADGYLSRWMAYDLGGAGLGNRPDEYGLPSISRLEITSESSSGGTLQIDGSFPILPGSGTITDASGTNPLAITAWSQNAITATLPVSGSGSAGTIQIFSSTGFASNIVPLSQWQGTIGYREIEDPTSLGGTNGHGSGSLAIAFNIEFRGDVHPTVPSIDASPVPQNLYFPQVENNSTASVTALQGSFTSDEGTPPPADATFSLIGPGTMVPAAQPLSDGTFIVAALPGQPSPCNNGTAGPEGDAGNVMCPGFGYLPTAVGVCSPDPDDTYLCAGRETFSPGGSFGAASLLDPGLVLFTMNPATYAIDVSAADTNFTRPFGIANWGATGSVSGAIGSPQYAPTGATPAFRARSGSSEIRR
jgi:hypothetical protein